MARTKIMAQKAQKYGSQEAKLVKSKRAAARASKGILSTRRPNKHRYRPSTL
jgi:hypothetical protein